MTLFCPLNGCAVEPRDIHGDDSTVGCSVEKLYTLSLSFNMFISIYNLDVFIRKGFMVLIYVGDLYSLDIKEKEKTITI